MPSNLHSMYAGCVGAMPSNYLMIGVQMFRILLVQSEEKVTVGFRILGLVYNLEYLSQFFFKFKMQGLSQNSHHEQNSKLSLIYIFGRKLTGIFKTFSSDCMTQSNGHADTPNIYSF